MKTTPYKTNVYVDCFNLYYGSLKDTPYKWLDMLLFCQKSLTHNQIHRIRCFLAKVSARPNDPQQPVRQQTYLRALQTIPCLSIHYGHYLHSNVRMPLVHPLPGGPATVEVVKTEEKGSDVNLATYLLTDAFDHDFEAAVVISNDSDLAEPIRIVRHKFRVPVIVLHPCRAPRFPSSTLRNVASKSITVDPAILAASQFPTTLTDTNGTITKPVIW